MTLGTLDTCTCTEKLLKKFNKYFTFMHNAYLFDRVIINVAKYNNPEYFQNITFVVLFIVRLDNLPSLIYFS